MLGASRQQQQGPLGTGMLDGRAHKRVGQPIKNNLARDGLRHLNHGREVEVLDGRRDRARRSGRRPLRSEARIRLVKLPYLAVSSPAEIAVTSVSQVGIGRNLEATSGIKMPGKLAGERLVLDKAVCL